MAVKYGWLGGSLSVVGSNLNTPDQEVEGETKSLTAAFMHRGRSLPKQGFMKWFTGILSGLGCCSTGVSVSPQLDNSYKSQKRRVRPFGG